MVIFSTTIQCQGKLPIAPCNRLFYNTRCYRLSNPIKLKYEEIIQARGLKGWSWRYQGTSYLFNLIHFIFREACRIFGLKGAFGRTVSMFYLQKIYIIP